MSTPTSAPVAGSAPAATPAQTGPQGNPAANTGYASASLYVGELSPDVTEALLFEIFNAVGPVASVRVCRDAATRRSLGYAYVNYHRMDDAERALDTMNFTPIRGRACRIMWSHRDPSLRRSGTGNIFVKNLAPSIDNKTLHDTFSVFGNILSCKVAVNAKRESLGYGFVHFESDESAKAAIERVNGNVIADHKVQVTAFKSRADRGVAGSQRFTNVYVKNLPEDMTVEQLNKLFSEYGTITSSVIQAADGKSKCFGFVNFSTPEEAQAAVERGNNMQIGGKTLFVTRAKKKEEREKELREEFERAKIERQKKYAGINLYVKNLAENIDDKRLREEFVKFGDIMSAKVMTDAGGKSRGFGFVCFSTPDEATRAVTEMNGKMIESKPLYVSLAQRKEVRRAQLEQQYAARASKAIMPQPGMYPPQGPAMYFPGPQGMPQRMMYPQQMGMRPWAARPQRQAGPGPQMGMHAVYGQMGGMPGVPGRIPGPRGAQAGQRPPRQGQQGGTAPAGAGRGRAPNQNFKYTTQVRNRDQGVVPAQPVAQPQAVPVPAAMPQSPLTIQALAAAQEEQQKQMIGERLFPLIERQEPQLAGKITGMLLEMDNGELLHLLESAEARNEKIHEALQVLQQHQSEE